MLPVRDAVPGSMKFKRLLRSADLSKGVGWPSGANSSRVSLEDSLSAYCCGVAASEPNQHPSQDWPSCDLSTPAGDGDGTAVSLSEMTNHFEGFLSS